VRCAQWSAAHTEAPAVQLDARERRQQAPKSLTQAQVRNVLKRESINQPPRSIPQTLSFSAQSPSPSRLERSAAAGRSGSDHYRSAVNSSPERSRKSLSPQRRALIRASAIERFGQAEAQQSAESHMAMDEWFESCAYMVPVDGGDGALELCL